MKARSRTMLDDHLPSRRDIRAACDRIQNHWSETERRKRAGLARVESWAPPLIRGNQLGLDFESEPER